MLKRVQHDKDRFLALLEMTSFDRLPSTLKLRRASRMNGVKERVDWSGH